MELRRGATTAPHRGRGVVKRWLIVVQVRALIGGVGDEDWRLDDPSRANWASNSRSTRPQDRDDTGLTNAN